MLLARRTKPKCKTFATVVVICVAVLMFLHLVALPNFSGGYNDECFLPDKKRRILRTMVQTISRSFDKFGVKYWLDYGRSIKSRVEYLHVWLIYTKLFPSKIYSALIIKVTLYLQSW